MLAYQALRGFLQGMVRVFFRQVEVVGLENVPSEGEGPLIFVGNHPNSLLDPVMVVSTCGRVVHFAAKDVLFRSRALRVFLDALGAVPIARRSDHGEGAVDNAGAFEALFRVMAEGRAMGIFPEGLSHDEAQIQRLKTGAARIALGMATRHPEAPLRIIPCGLTYIRRRRFRGRALVRYGAAIEVADIAADASAGADDRAAVRALTERIDQGLRALTINAPDWETLRLLDGVRRLYQPPRISLADRIELARRFAEVYPEVKDRPDVQALLADVRDYLDRLRDLGVSDRELARELWPVEIAAKLLANLVYLFVWLPLSIPGVVLHAPLGLLVGWAGNRFAPRRDVIATTKLLLGTSLVLVAYAAVIGAALWSAGWRGAALAAILLPLSGVATLRILERGASLRRLAARGLRYTSLRAEIAARLRWRELEVEVAAAVDRLRPEDMAPLFPRAPVLDDDDVPG
ncbi:MAG: 1-acyl-sn-glycerol-3-phosphate acyltransferase [Myxococcales bacterium]|nr:1-acyl-sn-glycerol-3-phosphate acyltransferase [Myxococcales bacterium]